LHRFRAIQVWQGRYRPAGSYDIADAAVRNWGIRSVMAGVVAGLVPAPPKLLASSKDNRGGRDEPRPGRCFNGIHCPLAGREGPGADVAQADEPSSSVC